VIVVARNVNRCENTVDEIIQTTGNHAVEYMLADLSSQNEIHDLAEAYQNKYDHLDVLVNNAGGFFMSRQESADGIEMTFALNHLNYFLLTNLLLDTIKASAPARIVNVSSAAHQNASINFDDLQGKKKYSGWQAYGQSKLANILFTYELARRLEGTGVTVNALHPGMVATNFGANNGGVLGSLVRQFMNLFSIGVEDGAQTSIYLASSPEVEDVTGKYFVKKKAVSSSSASYDESAAKRLWEISEEMTGVREKV
jgi:NAD(P)-dependent dehydrogenase (short-subunit alcohol dehydrogenase family)